MNWTGHIINKRGIPEVCPGCDREPMTVKVVDYDPTWYDGRVVCAFCDYFIRTYDAG